eukprot:SM000212S06884  [mRNA]  locus=s212:19705:21226:+ [translate_table: standard]
MADPAGGDDEALGEPQPTAQEQEAMLRKKYGGLLPKNPLICKDHERKFFDSADWALNNQGAARPKPRMPQEDLQPKFELVTVKQARTPWFKFRDYRTGWQTLPEKLGANTGLG